MDAAVRLVDRLPWWKAMSPSKNTEFGIGALLNRLDLWFLSRQNTENMPVLVRDPAAPEVIGTGP